MRNSCGSSVGFRTGFLKLCLKFDRQPVSSFENRHKIVCWHSERMKQNGRKNKRRAMKLSDRYLVINKKKLAIIHITLSILFRTASYLSG